MKRKFVCPECGCKEMGMRTHVTRPQLGIPENNPWSSIVDILSCKNCKKLIPGHLGYCSNSMSVGNAKKRWEEDFRERDIGILLSSFSRYD
tara:strand:+ start:22 stop:294 length:273 start_codon:yes stop_codon:yes gene_type:complete